MQGQEACDYKIRFAQIAAAGNKPQDWKEYIDEVKLRTQSWDDYKQNRIIAYFYHKAFEAISNTDKSLSHAQLIVDYAELKSQQDQNEATKLLQYCRRNFPCFAIVHVASAELELKRGNKTQAFSILKMAASVGAKPVSCITLALHRLNEGKTCLNDDTTNQSNADSSTSGNDSSEELSSSKLSNHFRSEMQIISGSLASTQEVQNDLDALTSVPVRASAEVRKTEKFHDSPQEDSISQTSIHMRTPEPPVLRSRKYELSKESGDQSSARQTQGPRNLHTFITETPQGQHLLSDIHESSTAKKTLFRFHSSPDIRQSHNSIRSSAKKFKFLNLGPPRRVKIDPGMRKLSDEEEEDSCSQNITGSTFDLYRSQPEPTEWTQNGAQSGTFISSTRYVSESNSLSAHSSIMLPTSSSSVSGCSESSIRSVLHNKNEYPTNRSCDELKEKSGEYSQKSQYPLLKVQTTMQLEAPKKLSPSVPDSFSYRTDTVPESVNRHINTIPQSVNQEINNIPQHVNNRTNTILQPVNNSIRKPLSQLTNSASADIDQTSKAKCTGQEMGVESSKEIAKQQEMMQLVWQLVQQAGINCKTFSVADQQSVIASTVTPAKPHGMSDQKTVFVNGKAYTVLNLVGRGGSAKVYQVCDPVSNTLRALKCVDLEGANQFIVEGYKNEISLLKKLQHCDRVIKLYDSEYIESTKTLLVVLEYGETDLCKFISQNEKNRKVVHSIAVRYFWLQMVSAVNAMHKEGVIHSDLKPANFILVSGEVKLIDFGIANSLQQDNTSILKENVVGTPSYMSPEMLIAFNAGHGDSKPKYKVGVRSDVWSLGCILYQMVYGHTPFQHIKQKLEAIVNPAYHIPFPDNEDLDLMDVLKKCLSRNIELRPTTDDLLKHPYLQK